MISGIARISLAITLCAFVFDAQAQRVKEEDTIASLDGQIIELKRHQSVISSTDLARDNYRAFLEVMSEDPVQRAEAMRRLGDLELDAIEAEQLAENLESIDPEAYDNAVGMFLTLLKEYPDYRRNDSVLYQLARAYEIGGQTDEALETLNQLAARYPSTELADEVQFRRGEMLFLRKNYDDAEVAYQFVVEYGDTSKFYEQSLYKLGWSQFKLAKHDDSLSPFFECLIAKLVMSISRRR